MHGSQDTAASAIDDHEAVLIGRRGHGSARGVVELIERLDLPELGGFIVDVAEAEGFTAWGPIQSAACVPCLVIRMRNRSDPLELSVEF